MGKFKKRVRISAVAILCVVIGVASYRYLRGTPIEREISSLKTMVQDSPYNIEYKHRLGLLYMYQGDFNGAEEQFLGVLSMDPYNTRALTSIGMMYYNKGEPHNALTYWRSLLEIEPENQFVWNLVNEISSREGGGGVSHEGVEIASPEWRRHYRQGQDSYQKEDYRSAAEHFEKAAELNPADFRTHFNIGSSYYAMKEMKKALESWQTALKYKKTDLLTLKLVALVEGEIERGEVIEEALESLKREPSKWEHHERLAGAYSENKDTVEDAQREYMEVLRLNPSRIPAYDRLIELNIRLDDYDRAIHFARKRLSATGGQEDSLRKNLNTLMAYNELLKKGLADWKENGIAPYGEMVTIKGDRTAPFDMDKYEITNAQYRAFLGDTGHSPPPQWNDSAREGKENYPVTNVSWYDAMLYCKWADKRLPNEREWTEAGWSGSGAKYPWGNDFDAGAANTAGSGFGKPTPAGSYGPHNGLYDMVGNVMEWTSDGEAVKVKKGGAFRSEPDSILPSSKWTAPPTQRDSATGFRCAR